MNLIELWKAMDEGEVASSPNSDIKIIKRDYGLMYYDTNQDEEYVQLNANYICDEDWEIELPYVDFWTAWQAAKNEGWAIKYEYSSCPYAYANNPVQFTKDMINGRWQILK